jgi:hypothetical protein
MQPRSRRFLTTRTVIQSTLFSVLATLASDATLLAAQGPVDTPPTVEILSPTTGMIARPDVRVRARCLDDKPGCRVRLLYPTIEGNGEIDVVMSVAESEGGSASLSFVATDSAGQVNTAQSFVFVNVESSRRLLDVSTYAGYVLDVDSTRILLSDRHPYTYGARVYIIDRATGASESFAMESQQQVYLARLVPGGAVVVAARYPYYYSLHHWRNGSLVDLGSVDHGGDVRVAGAWVVYASGSYGTPKTLVRRNLTTETSVTVSPTALSYGFDVADNGDVAYLQPTGYVTADLYRYRNGSVTPLVAGTARTESAAVTDGQLVAFLTTETANFPPFALELHTPSGVELLADGLPALLGRMTAERYQVVNGWTAFVRPGTGGGEELWTRNPAGVRRLVAESEDQIRIERLNSQGDVTYGSLVNYVGRRWLARASGEPPIEVGSLLGRPLWVDGAWHVALDGALLRLTTERSLTLSEGATGSFFATEVAILNPDAAPVSARVSFVKEGGERVEQTREVPAHARTTVRVNDALGPLPVAVSTLVTAPESAPLVVERTMTWDATGYGGHSGSAVETPRMKWLFAEGAQGYFDTFLLLVNNSARATEARLTFLVEGGSPARRTVGIAAHARVTVHAGAIPELVNRSFSTVVEADTPIGAERAMYFGAAPQWTGGHESAGVADPATDWFHAEGATGPVFDTYILLGNPNAEAANVTVTFLTDGGTTVTLTRTLLPLSRHTIPVDGVPQLANVSFATTVHSNRPIVSERAMYWSTTGGEWQEAHNSFGLTTTGTKWATADGRAGGTRRYQTYVLVANPSSNRAELEVTFMRTDGLEIVRTLALDAGRRLNIFCNDVPELANAEFGVVVESTNGVPIAVERATYWDAGGVTWAAGTNVVATRIP